MYGVKDDKMMPVITSISIAIFEALLYSLTMFGVARRKKRYKLVVYMAFFGVVICLNIFLQLNVFWQCLLYYTVFISAYKFIFDTSLYKASYGGLVVYLLLSTNQMFLAILSFMKSGEIIDYRDVFPSLPAYLYIPSLILVIVFIFLYNFCISYPQKQFKITRTSWFEEGPQHINLILSATFLFVMSWNIKFFYVNHQNMSILSGMTEKIFILLMLVFLAFVIVIYVVNRTFIQPQIKREEKEDL